MNDVKILNNLNFFFDLFMAEKKRFQWWKQASSQNLPQNRHKCEIISGQKSIPLMYWCRVMTFLQKIVFNAFCLFTQLRILHIKIPLGRNCFEIRDGRFKPFKLKGFCIRGVFRGGGQPCQRSAKWLSSKGGQYQCQKPTVHQLFEISLFSIKLLFIHHLQMCICIAFST